ncbi:MAG: PEP-CTERM sorting domain-containing protein [Planctomycetota bacterium]
MMKRLRNFTVLGLTFALVLFAGTEARSDIAVTFDGPTDLVVGQSATYQLFATSDSADILDAFGVTLSISGGSGLVFSDLQSDAYLTDSDYVFFNRSGNVALGQSGITSDAGSLSFADFSDDQSQAPNPGMSDPFTFGSGSVLLGEFSLDAVSFGDFSIVAEPDPATSFLDPGFSTITFSSTSFNVSAVPEPSGVLLAGGMVAFLIHRRRKSMRKA